jgi:hypothetical protein
MDELNYDSLKRFDLTFPGHWIKGENRDEAFHTQHILSLIQGLLTEAVVSYALFRPITAANVEEYIARFKRGDESAYERCLNGLYAKTFVFALNGIENLLNRLAVTLSPPEEIKNLYEKYKRLFGHLKHIRDSAIHIEDRGRGKTRKQEPLDTHIIVLGGFIERRYTFTGEDGKDYEIEISESTLKTAKAIIQDIINSYSWM